MFYWVHDESCSAGYVETERALEITLREPCVDHVSREIYEQRVKDGYVTNGPCSMWLLDEAKRAELFNLSSELMFKMENVKATFQNEGCCIKSSYNDLMQLNLDIINGLQRVLTEAASKCKEVK